ncbi:MAG TPA: protein phosphatase 2C domain-containing protein [Kofleriaceae bacterium]|nr:protein phosphatase 2C domain-containing protein [Kofleriaceae bacterium]
MKLELAVAAGTDIGAVRDHNEDHFLVGDLDNGGLLDAVTAPWKASADRGVLLVVCDGMGGVVGGEVASELAAKVIWREMKETAATKDPEVFARLLRRATRVANHEVHAMSRREAGLRGMGTTVSAAGVAGNRLVVATVGDSRAYILRNGVLVQITRDQSLQSALLAAGHDPDEAEKAGSAILQALGVGPDVEPSLSIIDLRRGDRVLLCSDGLHGLVGDPALALLMSAPHTVGQAVNLLVTAARAAGGTDNITAVVADLGGDRLPVPTSEDDLPTFREFDPQKEGDPALSSSSYVARRLAAKIGLPSASFPPSIPVTGQHAVLRSQIGIRVPATALPIEDVDGPARAHLRMARIQWWVIIAICLVCCAIAWVLGGR